MNDSNENAPNNKSTSKENNFFKHLRTKENLRRSSSEDSTTLDVIKYAMQPLSDPNLLEFCSSPILLEVFLRYNTTLSSSGPVERIFSKALAIFTHRRNRISDTNFEKALFIYQNKSLLN